MAFKVFRDKKCKNKTKNISLYLFSTYLSYWRFCLSCSILIELATDSHTVSLDSSMRDMECKDLQGGGKKTHLSFPPQKLNIQQKWRYQAVCLPQEIFRCHGYLELGLGISILVPTQP